jgi:predicted transcriptional regulator
MQLTHIVDMAVDTMGHTTVRVSEATRDLLRRLAAREGTAMQTVLERALEGYRRRRFLEEVNAGYASLRADRRAWSRVQAERRTWDATLADGLPAKPRPRAVQGRRRRARR